MVIRATNKTGNKTKGKAEKPEKEAPTPETQPEPKASRPVKSEEAHAKAEQNDAKAGKKQMELVAITPEQRLLELGELHRGIIAKEEELIEAEHTVKEIKDEKAKLEAKRLTCLNIISGIPVQQKMEVQDSKKNDDKRFMDQSSYKTPEELRRHPQKEAEG